MTREINFDGLIGPTHNYAGLSLGNVASAANAGSTSRPRDAALQGLRKMRMIMDLGLPQGFFLPHERPDAGWLRQLGFTGTDAEVCAAAHHEDPKLFNNAASASAMWTANAATVSPAADTSDGRVHLTPANLSAMPHRSLEWRETYRQLSLMFADTRHFAVHPPVPGKFGDEGAANFMRIAPSPGERGTEVFVYGQGTGTGRFPARQSRRASEAAARKHGVADAIFTPQATHAVEAGAFHNDVVAVANESVLFAHELAFDDRNWLYEELARRVPGFTLVEVPAAEVSLEDAISSYLFNSQLVTLPGSPGSAAEERGMALILPEECRENARVKAWLDANVGGAHPIHTAHFIDVRESMRNGGGPACLRLRVAVSEAAEAAIDRRFLLDERKADRLERLIEARWPEAIAPADLGSRDLWEQAWTARRALLEELGLSGS